MLRHGVLSMSNRCIFIELVFCVSGLCACPYSHSLFFVCDYLCLTRICSRHLPRLKLIRIRGIASSSRQCGDPISATERRSRPVDPPFLLVGHLHLRRRIHNCSLGPCHQTLRTGLLCLGPRCLCARSKSLRSHIPHLRLPCDSPRPTCGSRSVSPSSTSRPRNICS